MIRQRSAHPPLAARGRRAQQKERSISVPSRLVTAPSPRCRRRLCEREVKPAQSCFSALFRPIFQSDRFVAINNVKRAGRNKALMMIDPPDVRHIYDDASLLSDASICLRIPSVPANFPALPFPVPVSLSDSGQKWRRSSGD